MLLTDLISSTSFNIIKNVRSTTDPTANDDISTGVSVFSVWQNTTTKQVFDCKSNAAGAAVWDKRLDSGNLSSYNFVTSDVTLGGNTTTKIPNIVAVSNTNFSSLTPNANTAYFIDG